MEILENKESRKIDLTGIYYHRLKWVDDFKQVDDQIHKFEPTTSGPGSNFHGNILFRIIMRKNLQIFLKFCIIPYK